MIPIATSKIDNPHNSNNSSIQELKILFKDLKRMISPFLNVNDQYFSFIRLINKSFSTKTGKPKELIQKNIFFSTPKENNCFHAFEAFSVSSLPNENSQMTPEFGTEKKIDTFSCDLSNRNINDFHLGEII